jgi:hypothetical protein
VSISTLNEAGLAMRRSVLFLAALALLFGGVGKVSADLITFYPSANAEGTTLPFGLYGGEYQQVYGASSFSGGPILITNIAFITYFGNGPSNSETLNLTMSLSVTNNASPASISSDFLSNEGSSVNQVFSGTHTFAPQNEAGVWDLVFAITPFLYDPTQGNLLLDANINSITYNPGGFEDFVFGTGSQFGRAYNGGSDSDTGLATQFTFSAVPTPEPSSLTLLGLGTFTLLGYGWRRRKRTAA